MALKKDTKNRGTLLTTLLFLHLFGLVSMIYRLVSNTGYYPMGIYAHVPSWYPAFVYIQAFLSALSFIGIWTWKKWSFYLIFLTLLFGISVGCITLTPYALAFMIVVSGIGQGLLMWSMYRKWKYFA